MRWGTYSDNRRGTSLLATKRVSIAHALGNLFRQETTIGYWERFFSFQSLMRWGTYSDNLSGNC